MVRFLEMLLKEVEEILLLINNTMKVIGNLLE